MFADLTWGWWLPQSGCVIEFIKDLAFSEGVKLKISWLKHHCQGFTETRAALVLLWLHVYTMLAQALLKAKGKGQGRKRRSTERREDVCVCVEGWSTMEALGTGTVFAQGYWCMFRERKREREDGEKENLPLSLFIISTNFFRQGWEEASRTGSCVSGMCPLRHGLGPHWAAGTAKSPGLALH